MNAKVLFHSSIRAEAEKIVWFDPYKINGAPRDADIIFITHDHFDHFSPDDIEKIKKPETVFVVPKRMEQAVSEYGNKVISVAAGDKITIDGIDAEAVPAYNVGKPFHPKSDGWLGYIVTLGGERIYVAGDTDINDDVKQVKCDAAFLPAGGKFTMTAAEAAALANIIKPKKAVPTHYGEVAGTPADGEEFARLTNKEITVEVQLKF